MSIEDELSPDELADWNERSAIREYHGNQTREKAEIEAYLEICERRLAKHGDQATTIS